ncbi:MAG: RNA-binding protein [Candidatus Thorarchaeota archaeon]|nr:RNA-binding protein [Candidatus Thorarchaeota archaeon]
MPKIEKIKKRHHLKKKEQKAEIDRIENALGCKVKELDEKSQFETGLLDDGTRILMLRNEILFFEKNGTLFPSLHALLKGMVIIPKITVDMGAIRYVVNGADIMRPGITKIDDDILEDSVVAIVDEKHGKPLAVGQATMDSVSMRAATKGKAVLSIHYVNDHLWDFTKG